MTTGSGDDVFVEVEAAVDVIAAELVVVLIVAVVVLIVDVVDIAVEVVEGVVVEQAS